MCPRTRIPLVYPYILFSRPWNFPSHEIWFPFGGLCSAPYLHIDILKNDALLLEIHWKEYHSCFQNGISVRQNLIVLHMSDWQLGSRRDRMLASALNFAIGFFGYPLDGQYQQSIIIEAPGVSPLSPVHCIPFSDRTITSSTTPLLRTKR